MSVDISCVTVTKDRFDLLSKAVKCFHNQVHYSKELIIVTDGEEAYAKKVKNELGKDPRIKVVHVEQNSSLGHLRNMSILHASGMFICQWDDDDMYHPQRLSAQLDHVNMSGPIKACVFTAQLHYFANTKEVFYCERLGGIEGTLMCERRSHPVYPNTAKGEDTVVFNELKRRNALTCIDGSGWLYLRTYHGNNTWNEQHHRSVALSNAASSEFVEDHRDLLKSLLVDVYGLKGVKMMGGREVVFTT